MWIIIHNVERHWRLINLDTESNTEKIGNKHFTLFLLSLRNFPVRLIAIFVYTLFMFVDSIEHVEESMWNFTNNMSILCEVSKKKHAMHTLLLCFLFFHRWFNSNKNILIMMLEQKRHYCVSITIFIRNVLVYLFVKDLLTVFYVHELKLDSIKTCFDWKKILWRAQILHYFLLYSNDTIIFVN